MAEGNVHVHAFNAGEVSNAALARIDQERVRLTAQVQENLLPATLGKAVFRPGFQYLVTPPGQGRLVKFVKTVTDTAQLVLLNGAIQFLVNDAFVTRPSVTSTVSDGTFSSASTDRAVAATITAVTTASGSTANLVDGDPATVWVSSATATQTLTFDLATARTIYHLWMMGDSTSSSTIQRAPTAFTVQGSSTGAFGGEQVTLLTVSGAANWALGEERTYTLTSPGSYRYYRISMTANKLGSGSYRIAGISLWDTAWRFKRVGFATLSVASGVLNLSAPYRGGYAVATQQVSTSSSGTEHALDIHVTNGPVLFRVGSTDGDDDLVTTTELATGYHSLAFTPAGSTYWVEFSTDLDRGITVNSCTVASSGALSLTAPWVTAELNEIQYAQEGDDVWLAHDEWRTRIVQRRGTTSWSLVEYLHEDGPFTISRTAPVELTPSATRGYGVTLSSNRPFFKATHVGALFKLTHDRFNATFNLAAPNTFTDTWRVAGIALNSDINDRKWVQVTAGSWGGTLRDQRTSTDPGETGFSDFRREIGEIALSGWGNNVTYVNADADDNVIMWHRIGFIPDEWDFGYATVEINYPGYGGSGICRVTSVTNSTTAVVEVLTPFKNIVATSDWQEGQWSDLRGHPSAVKLYDGRIWLGDASAKFAGSVSNNLYSFDETVEGASGSVQRSVQTGSGAGRINSFLPLQRLLMLTDAAEVSARSSSFDAPITPDDLTLKDAGNQGSSRASPVKSGSRGYIIDRSQTKVFVVAYDVESNDYTSRSLMRYHDEIGLPGIVQIDFQHHPEPYCWAVLADGRCAVLLHNPQEEVAAWFRVISEGDGTGDIESLSVLPSTTEDRVYVIVKRVLNGATVRTIEKMALRSEAWGDAVTKMADCFTYAAGPVSSVTAAQLANETGLIGWGVTAGGVKTILTGLSANGSGVISLGATYSNVCVGLPYGWRYQSSKLAYGAEHGTALLQTKRVGSLGLLAERVYPGAITYGADFSHLFPMPLIEDGTTLPTTTVLPEYDAPSLPVDGTWDTDARVCLAGSAPYPVTLLGLVLGIETND